MQIDSVARRPRTTPDPTLDLGGFEVDRNKNGGAVSLSKALDKSLSIVKTLDEGARAAQQIGKYLKFQADMARLLVLKMDAIAAAASGDIKRAKAIAKEVAGIAKELHGLAGSGGGTSDSGFVAQGDAAALAGQGGPSAEAAVAGQSTSTVTAVSASGAVVAAEATVSVDSRGVVTENVRAVGLGPTEDRTGVKAVTYAQTGGVAVGYDRMGAVHAVGVSHSTLTQAVADNSGMSVTQSTSDVEVDASLQLAAAGGAAGSGQEPAASGATAVAGPDGFAASLAQADELARKIIDFLRRAFARRRGGDSQDFAHLGRELAAATISIQSAPQSSGTLVDLNT